MTYSIVALDEAGHLPGETDVLRVPGLDRP
jgi:hypothetical protein